MRIIRIILCALFITSSLHAQTLKGTVVEVEAGKELSLPGATIQLIPGGQVVVTDSAGRFEITGTGRMVISYPGYVNDTIDHFKSGSRIVLKKPIGLTEVEVTAKSEALKISTINPVNIETITQGELLKAACCNLSEAFETNPSVNVAYKDAVTGVKEIQLLGLGGRYVQMLGENMPEMRGLGGIYGLTFIPGPWIESIQLTKGSGSAIYGSESTTGQINVEFKKPTDVKQPRLFLNLFAEGNGSMEANAIWKKNFKRWNTMLMTHGRLMTRETDGNSDGFMDVPGNKSINLYNRWNYQGKRMESQINMRFLADEINGGQVEGASVGRLYQTGVSTRRADVSGKLGIVYPEKPAKSIGNIAQFTYHDMNSFFGDKIYNARETSLFLQSIYQNILWMSNHRYRAGFTYRFDRLNQEFTGLPALAEEHVPGAFMEYTYSYFDKLTLIGGLRADLHEGRSEFIPRFHGKYNFTEDFIVRFSGGKSYRKPYLLADNLYTLASSRAIIIRDNVGPERAWNYGMNVTKRFILIGKEATITADAYRTEFISQVVVDTYSDSATISFYNLEGESFSNSFQVTLSIDLLRYLNLRLSYKKDDVKSTYNGILERVPLVAGDRFLGTISASTPNEHWRFDYTFVWEGRKRLQHVFTDEPQRNDNSPSFAVMNFQHKLFCHPPDPRYSWHRIHCQTDFRGG